MMSELLFCAAGPVLVIAALVLIGWIFRVDRKPKGGA